MARSSRVVDRHWNDTMAPRIRPSVEVILSPSSSLLVGVGTSLSNRAGLRAGRASPTTRSGRWVGLQLGQRWASGRFAAEGLDGPADAPRPSAIRSISDDVIEGHRGRDARAPRRLLRRHQPKCHHMTRRIAQRITFQDTSPSVQIARRRSGGSTQPTQELLAKRLLGQCRNRSE